ncbi:hypothetical protein CAEBREN_04613 [Caenorhabditis brenneri]|uniref:F-box domain-containing protein n=1 Tax=Caenorhabditis brenneri TaxID=135651 RepID=G0NXL2_CAEBE|nr:hypothetical protein CAEBREN_04613 [Caenorhabditis brenneri]
MTLPFQKLPFLVMQNILQIMGFLDLFLLSCTSAKTKRIVKNAFTTRNHILLVGVGEALALKIVSGYDENYGEQIFLCSEEIHAEKEFHVNIGTVDTVPANYSEEQDDGTLILFTYWSDPKIGFNVIHEAIFEVFGATVNEVSIDVAGVPAKIHQKEIEWLENKLPTLPSFAISGRCSFQDYIWLLKNVRTKNVVFFSMEPTEYSENNEIVNLEMEDVTITHGKWMKIHDIEAIKARNICLKDISLTDNEINVFLKNLGAFKEKSNMKELTLTFYRQADPEIVFEGLDVINEVQIKPVDSHNQWSFELANGEKCTVIYVEYDNDESDDLIFGFEIQIGN